MRILKIFHKALPLGKGLGWALFFMFLVSCSRQKGNESPTDIVNIPSNENGSVNKGDLPVIKFERDEFDFGTITQGEKVSHIFKFKNLGNRALVISSAASSCGCTVPEYPKQPVDAGKDGEVRVVFDSSNKNGMVTKEVTLVANTIPNKISIRIKANVFVPQIKK